MNKVTTALKGFAMNGDFVRNSVMAPRASLRSRPMSAFLAATQVMASATFVAAYAKVNAGSI